MFFNVAILKHTLNVTIAGFTVSKLYCFFFFLELWFSERDIRDFKIQRRDGNENVA